MFFHTILDFKQTKLLSLEMSRERSPAALDWKEDVYDGSHIDLNMSFIYMLF